MSTFSLAARFGAPLLALAALTSCCCDFDDCTVRGEGPEVPETRAVGVASRVAVGLNAEVFLAQGTTPALRLEAPRNVLDALRTETVGGELRIGPRSGVKLRVDHPIRIYLTQPTLVALDGSGATQFRGLTAWQVDDLILTMAGASTVELDVTAHGTIRTAASGASRVVLRGTAPAHNAQFSGASNLDCFSLQATAADLDCSGASVARVSVANTLAVRASGGSEIYYQGSPALTLRDVSGGSRVVKVN